MATITSCGSNGISTGITLPRTVDADDEPADHARRRVLGVAVGVGGDGQGIARRRRPRRPRRPGRPRTRARATTGICERTVMASRSCPTTSMATRAARCPASSLSPAPSPSLRTISREAALDLDLDVAVDRQRQGVEPGTEVGRRGGGPGTHGVRIGAGATWVSGAPGRVRMPTVARSPASSKVTRPTSRPAPAPATGRLAADEAGPDHLARPGQDTTGARRHGGRRGPASDARASTVALAPGAHRRHPPTTDLARARAARPATWTGLAPCCRRSRRPAPRPAGRPPGRAAPGRRSPRRPW